MTRVTSRAWDRLLWGVEFRSERHGRPLLIGNGWASQDRTVYPGEPSRPLLFTMRALARQWCQEKEASYAGRTDTCADWSFRPIRVREIVRKVGP